MFRLKLACVLSVNTEKRVGVDWPRTYGAAVSLDTGEVFTAAFESHGPDADIRYVGTQERVIMRLCSDQCGLRKVCTTFTVIRLAASSSNPSLMASLALRTNGLSKRTLCMCKCYCLDYLDRVTSSYYATVPPAQKLSLQHSVI